MLRRKKAKDDNGTLLSRACEMVAKYSSTIREQEEIIKKLLKDNEQLREQITNFRRQLQVTEPGGINAVNPTKQV